MEVENLALSILAVVSFGLLILVTGGVIYLTTAEWRDRRRQEREKRGR
ncbi:MAG TPA: hypothetical protein IGS37_03865 [Synechococcales cyanobacterium M55_K2018_004]|nr:hypothetical protein [Synechococcales cyanobacterium M55_K2018_004]